MLIPRVEWELFQSEIPPGVDPGAGSGSSSAGMLGPTRWQLRSAQRAPLPAPGNRKRDKTQQLPLPRGPGGDSSSESSGVQMWGRSGTSGRGLWATAGAAGRAGVFPNVPDPLSLWELLFPVLPLGFQPRSLCESVGWRNGPRQGSDPQDPSHTPCLRSRP